MSTSLVVFLITSPMQGVRIVCVCVFVCVCFCVSTALVSAMSPLKVKARYQQKALDTGNKMNVGIELKLTVQ